MSPPLFSIKNQSTKVEKVKLKSNRQSSNQPIDLLLFQVRCKSTIKQSTNGFATVPSQMQIDNQAINQWICYCSKLDTHDINWLTVPGYDRVNFLPSLQNVIRYVLNTSRRTLPCVVCVSVELEKKMSVHVLRRDTLAQSDYIHVPVHRFSPAHSVIVPRGFILMISLLVIEQKLTKGCIMIFDIIYIT